MSLPEPVASYEPGASFRAEIREQPQALRRLLEHYAEFARIADAMRERGPLVRIVGHGSSDNAATYGVYAFGVLAGRTALRDSIALTVSDRLAEPSELHRRDGASVYSVAGSQLYSSVAVLRSTRSRLKRRCSA